MHETKFGGGIAFRRSRELLPGFDFHVVSRLRRGRTPPRRPRFTKTDENINGVVEQYLPHLSGHVAAVASYDIMQDNGDDDDWLDCSDDDAIETAIHAIVALVTPPAITCCSNIPIPITFRALVIRHRLLLSIWIITWRMRMMLKTMILKMMPTPSVGVACL